MNHLFVPPVMPSDSSCMGVKQIMTVEYDLKSCLPNALVLLFFALGTTAHSTEWCADPGFFSEAKAKTHTIHNKFYMIETFDTALQCSPGNVAVLVGDRNVLLIDSVYRHADKHVIDAIRKLSDLPIKYLINTHGHKDHADSNFHYGGDEGAIIVAHRKAREYLSVTHTVINPNGATVTLSAQPEEGIPEITFDNNMQVHFEGETIRLIYIGPAHSAGDIAIHFTKSNAIHMGDLLQNGNLPFFDSDGDIENLLAGYTRVAELCDDETVVIPGHGRITDCASMSNFGRQVQTIVNRIKDGIEEGKSLTQILASRPARDFALPEHVANPVDPWVAGVYENLLQKLQKKGRTNSTIHLPK